MFGPAEFKPAGPEAEWNGYQHKNSEPLPLFCAHLSWLILVNPCRLVGLEILHRYALAGARVKNQTQLVLGSGLAFLASLVALVYQLTLMNNANFTITMGAYASCYYLVAGLNVVHLTLTVFISLGNWNRSRLGLYVSDHWHVDIVNIWWMWMTISSLLGAFALSFT